MISESPALTTAQRTTLRWLFRASADDRLRGEIDFGRRATIVHELVTMRLVEAHITAWGAQVYVVTDAGRALVMEPK
jgi:hypothetical protein